MISIFCGRSVRSRNSWRSQRALIRFLSAAFLIAGTTGVSGTAFAQTNGTWTAPGSGALWSSATNWAGGNIADGGGIATFDNSRGQLSNVGVTLDSNRTLGELRFDQGFSLSISGAGLLNMSASGLILNGVNSTISGPISFYNTVNGVSSVITGTGDLTKIGNGNISLNGANNFTGTVRLNQGALWLTSTTQDGVLGNIANSVELNGGILGISGTALTTNRTFNVGAGGGTIRMFAGANLNGLLTGSGTLVTDVGSTLALGGDVSGFTGAIRSEATTTFSGATALGAGGDVTIANTLNLSNSTLNNVNNRLSGRSIRSIGGVASLTGSGASTTENAGTLNLVSGNTTLNVNPAGTTTLSFTDVNRINRSTVHFRATDFGGAARFQVVNSPGTLIGGGGDPETSTTASILPFAIAGNAGVTSGTSLSFVTWDSGTQQIRRLNTTTGYASNLATATSLDNVNLGASTAVNAGGQTINSLRFGGAFTLSGSAGDVLTVNSGAILSTTSTAVIDAPLNFGSAEGVIFSSGALTVNGPISGTNGLTKAGIGILTLNGNSTYTGTTTIATGQLRLAGGTVTADGSAPSVLGQGTSAIELHSSHATITAPTRLWTTGNLVINRNINATLGAAQTAGIGTAGLTNNESLTINGNLSLNAVAAGSTLAFLALEGGDVAAEGITINGTVSGNGGLRANFGSYNILSGNNTYTGGTIIGGSSFATGTGTSLVVTNDTWDVRSNNALGTGTITFQTAVNATQPVSGTGRLLANGSSAVTLNNNIVAANGFASFGGTQDITVNGNLFLNSAATNNSVVMVDGNTVTLNGIINGGGLIKSGSGSLVMNGTSTYSGQTIIREGVLSVSTIGNGATAGNAGQAPASANYLILSGNAPGDTGTLRYTGSGESTDRLFTLGGTGGTIDASGSGALVFNNTGSVGMNFGNVNVSGLSLVVGAGAIATSTTTTAQLVVGSTVTSATAGLVPAGTVVTEVGPNFVRLSNVLTNTTALTAQTLTFTQPGGGFNRTLTLTGDNTGLNTLAPVLANGGNIGLIVEKTGTGTWQLTGSNTYTGGTVVSDGSLIINNASGSGTGTGNVFVAANGLLGGSGFILPGASNSITIDGTIAPGNSPGTMTLGSLATTTLVDLNGFYAFDLATAGTGNVLFDSGLSSPSGLHLAHDVLNVFGTLDLTGSTINITSLPGTGFDPLQNYSWLIATTNGGTLISLPTIGSVTGVDFASYSGNFFLGNSGGNLYLNFQAIPEPAALGIMGLLIAGLVSRRRR